MTADAARDRAPAAPNIVLPVAELTNISLARGAPSLDVDYLKAAAQSAFERV